MISEIMIKRIWGHFFGTNKIWSVYRYFIHIVYVLYEDCFKVWFEKIVKRGVALRGMTNNNKKIS